MSDCINRTKARTILGYSGVTPTASNEFVTKEQCIAMGAESSPLEKYKSGKELVNLDDIVKKNNDPDYLMFMLEPKGSIYDGGLMPLNDDLIMNKGAVELVIVDYMIGYFDIVCSKDIEFVHTGGTGTDIVSTGNALQCQWQPGFKSSFTATAMINGSAFCSINVRIQAVDEM